MLLINSSVIDRPIRSQVSPLLLVRYNPLVVPAYTTSVLTWLISMALTPRAMEAISSLSGIRPLLIFVQVVAPSSERYIPPVVPP